jgi:hypothetical protein
MGGKEMKSPGSALVLFAICFLGAGCGRQDSSSTVPAAPDLVGQWRASIQFRTGAFAAVKDLEFMYVFNAGGTMTESSNYDASPPVPPAYGIWRRTGSNRFEARYEFYATKAPSGIEEITSGGGWLPAGRGILTETITVAAAGDSFTSSIRYEPLDPAGKGIEGGGEAGGRGLRLKF